MTPREELEQLLAEYRATLASRLDRIEALFAAGRTAELARELHTLAGSAGTFGLPKVSAAARAAEESVADREALARHLQALRREAAGAV